MSQLSRQNRVERWRLERGLFLEVKVRTSRLRIRELVTATVTGLVCSPDR